ncbi:MAG: hypothetical protein JO261_11025 [Alphaproteobacteria bacterium]|nr:hypothetical protein [Alphaproteobacteria bacterium]MBV9694219.1 hypothetical protein [Alphaproteobacteria bacterium]
MSLSDLASLGTFISSFAVLISLIYLAKQITQNTKHTRALIQQGRVSGIAGQYLAMADADLATAWLTANGHPAAPADVRKRQFFLQCVAIQVRQDDTFTQHQHGLLDGDQFARSTRHMTERLRADPALRDFFRNSVIVNGPSTPYRAYIQELLSTAETPG